MAWRNPIKTLAQCYRPYSFGFLLQAPLAHLFAKSKFSYVTNTLQICIIPGCPSRKITLNVASGGKVSGGVSVPCGRKHSVHSGDSSHSLRAVNPCRQAHAALTFINGRLQNTGMTSYRSTLYPWYLGLLVCM